MPHPSRTTGVLTRFRRDVAGNALAIMAASVLPMVAAVGGAIDMSRNYMAKSRLQQACDAGVLAGRKLQGSQPYSAVEGQAAQYFRINFPDNVYGTQTATFTSRSVTGNEVAGNATVFVPSTLGSVVGYAGTDLAVNCSARLDISDTDIMFVLDLTGSMNCSSTAGVYCPNVDNGGVEWGSGTTNPDESAKLNSRSRIGALRNAVINFTNTLNGVTTSSTQVRYGFVPYAHSVNVGRLLDPTWINNTATYASRQALIETAPLQSRWNGYNTEYYCPNNYNLNGAQCTRTRWTHKNLSFDVSKFKTFASTRIPTRLNNSSMIWDGCVEERSTVAQQTFGTIPGDAYDLNMDAPASSQQTRWSPLWREVSYFRDANTSQQVFETVDSDRNQFSAACPTAAKLTETPDPSRSIRDYVLSFKGGGATYHDTGMIWGLRLISPTGLWASHNAPRPDNIRVRHIIFMTDGAMLPWDNFTGAYGIERHMNRVGGGATAQSELIARHNARFLAVCRLAREQYNVKVWAIAFGEQLANTKLADCADPGHAYQADNPETLNTIFQQIAEQVADLRLSR